ncbi:MAG: MFS transporter [Clostridia bacterium]|nr:MFS transporter [Clostridia bacterium]
MSTKLNYKRTIFVGFAFFLIIAFWQAYDNIIPKILTDKFGLPQAASGAIMAVDNILALFLLPLFGAISDRSRSRYGRRTPFIFIGTVVAVALLVLLSIPDSAQLKNLEKIDATEGAAYTEALETLWDANPNIRVEGESTDNKSFGEIVASINPFGGDTKKPLQSLISHERFLAITVENAAGETNPDYTAYVVPARQAYAASVTAAHPGALVAFMVILFLALIAMGVFRSPAVALMPDVTVKPLRSKGNAVINLMGSIGGVVVLLVGTVLGTGKITNALMPYTGFFVIVAILMLAALAAFLLTVREPKWAAEMEQESARLGIDNAAVEENKGDRRLTRGERASLLLILFSVVFWYMGYNAVASKYSVYASSVLNIDYNTTLLIANAAAIVAYIPVGFLTSRFGRKKMVLAGVLILGASFVAASFMRVGSPVWLMNLLFTMAGIGWATINVNSYPMVVELARGGDVGKYTGYYYTASMAAQVVTPVLSGVFMDIRFTTLFPYAAIFVALSFLTMLFVRHGDSTPTAGETIADGIGGGD